MGLYLLLNSLSTTVNKSGKAKHNNVFLCMFAEPNEITRIMYTAAVNNAVTVLYSRIDNSLDKNKNRILKTAQTKCPKHLYRLRY